MSEYIVQDPEACIEEEFDNLEEAVKFANECVQEHLDDHWDEDVECVTVSKVLYRAKKSASVKKEDCIWDEEEKTYVLPSHAQDVFGECNSFCDYDEICNYTMEPVQ